MINKALLGLTIFFFCVFLIGVYTGIMLDDGDTGGVDFKFYATAMFSLIPTVVLGLVYGFRSGKFEDAFL